MANFTALFAELDALDASVSAVEMKITELRNSDDPVDQAEADALAARVDAAKDKLDAAVAAVVPA